MLVKTTHAGSENSIQGPYAQSAAGPVAGLIGYFVTSAILYSVNESHRADRIRLQDLIEESREVLLFEIAGHIQRAVSEGKLVSMVHEIVSDQTDVEQPGLLVRIKEPNIVIFDTWCNFDADLRRLNLFAVIQLWKRGSVKPSFEKTLAFSSKLEQEGDTRFLTSLWSENDFYLLHSSVKNGARDIVGQFIALTQQDMDLSVTPSR